MKIIWRWNTFKQFQNHQPSIFRPLQEPAPPASGFPIGFGQPQQANNLVITQLGRNMQWIPSFLGPSPRSKWRMKLATQLTNCGCNPAYFKTHKNIQKRFDAYLANPGGTELYLQITTLAGAWSISGQMATPTPTPTQWRVQWWPHG